MSVETLQKRLETNAKAEAAATVDGALTALPHFTKMLVTVTVANERIVRHPVSRSDILPAMREAMLDQLYPKILKRMTDEVLGAINTLEALKSGLSEPPKQ